jgi:predicted Zn-dependent peptidase
MIAGMVTAASAQNDLKAPGREQLLNGLKVLMWPDASADKVWVKLRIHAGPAFDPLGKEGSMQLLADNLFPNPAVKEFFAEDLGGSLEIITTYDYIQINASSKPDEMLQMLETIATAVSNPQIDKDTTNTLRNALLAKVKDLETDPAYIADRAAAGRLLGAFPYGRPQFGTSTSLQKIDFADMIDAKARFLTADNATLTISGKVDRALAFRAVRRYFGSWLKADRKVPATFRNPDAPPPGILHLPSPKADLAVVRLLLRGSARGEREFAASQVFTRILETRVRAKMSPENAGAMVVRNDQYVLPGLISVALAIPAKDLSGDGKVEANDVVFKALTEPVSDTEFQAARSLARTDWLRRDTESFWLDLDTYKIADLNGYRNAFDTLQLTDVNAYADRLRKQPSVTVVVRPTPVTK